VADSCRCLTQVATENPSLSANFPFENSVPSKCACQVVVVARPRRSIIIVKQANGCFWRKAAVRAWDELATEDLARPVDATHLQHDQLKLLKLSN
jgi:hypothetical protein